MRVLIEFYPDFNFNFFLSFRVRQSRSLNRISELHVVADFNGHEDMLSRYLDSVSRGQTRSRDDSLTSSGEKI